MDHATLSSKSVIEALLRSNRPPTDQERALIQESMAPTNAKLKIVQTQISDTVAHIQALKLQVEQAEIRLQRLREEEAGIWETSEDPRRVLSVLRTLPEDVVREIFIACVEDDMPTLSYDETPMPYVLTQISSGMRHIALTTPAIWASMNVEIRSLQFDSVELYEQAYSDLAQRASEWFERAGGLALTVFIQDADSSNARPEGSESDPSDILFDTLLSYSNRWKEVHFDSFGSEVVSPHMLRIAALTAVDIPLLQSVSLHLDCITPNPVLHNSVLLTIPTLQKVKLIADTLRLFTVNWPVLTSITLRRHSYDYYHSMSEIARILQQIKCLVFCDIAVGPTHSEEHYAGKIDLPFLKNLCVSEQKPPSGAPSILDLITAPTLEIFHVELMFLDLSLSNFLKRSPRIWKLCLQYFDADKSLMDTMGFLRHCPSLTVLCLWSFGGMDAVDANRFLRAFVEKSDASIICPRLQYFNVMGRIDFSVQTLRLFLESKQGNIATLNLLPWKRVAVDIRDIRNKDTEACQQILDLVSQKKAEGLDVDAFLEDEGFHKDRHIFF
ncbi:hypothetical protein HYPSUDRAFT_214078 [Hypholoma sublateritium FD-334 SS-4]|uniref:F-box domain-containing protein n=1 Tax=Hypholoma sublateritium (strain FD-334 SS-4) TaxID=945553 RepID=A0A0D2Q1H3_HYPSF|nr:hypothetical protein HYPSUDRAFT_214078 [Hypholoma sublateritium FD-334 SS-4]